MKWDQIESRWALMTQRIRADLCDERAQVTRGLVQTRNRRDAVGPTVAISKHTAPKDPECKTSSK